MKMHPPQRKNEFVDIGQLDNLMQLHMRNRIRREMD